jgi:hypothetical protein
MVPPGPGPWKTPPNGSRWFRHQFVQRYLEDTQEEGEVAVYGAKLTPSSCASANNLSHLINRQTDFHFCSSPAISGRCPCCDP